MRKNKDREYHSKASHPTCDTPRKFMESTSFNYICTSECRYRRKSYMSKVDFEGTGQFTNEQIKLLTLTEETKSMDGCHYICKACMSTIKAGRIPSCNEKTYKFRITPLPLKYNSPNMKLNRLEGHLLKLIIPFISIVHITHSRDVKIKGPMISVEADIKPTIDKLLPRCPQLIPVALKRKLEYKGNYIEEMVDTQKVLLYFDYFKKYYPLFD